MTETIDVSDKENDQDDSQGTDSSMDRSETTELEVKRTAGTYKVFIQRGAGTCRRCLCEFVVVRPHLNSNCHVGLLHSGSRFDHTKPPRTTVLQGKAYRNRKGICQNFTCKRSTVGCGSICSLYTFFS